MISRALCVAALASAVIAAGKPRIQLTESERVERGLAIVRLDPKLGARPGECDDLAVSDLSIAVGVRPAKVTSVERVPRPLRHWLLIDISESAEAKRAEAMRSAAQYVREVMAPGVDAAAVVTVDEDAILVAGPSTDPEALAREIERILPGGWSALRDGFDTVLRQIRGDRHEHLVLFWTDGQDQSSVIRNEELYRTLERAPNATVFPIALRSQESNFPPPPGMTFMEVALRSRGEVFVSSDPRWLDRVRGWIARRFTVGFVPPPETTESPAVSKLVIDVPGKRCQVTLLDDPFARPDPVSGASLPAPEAWVRLHKPARQADEFRCESGEGTPPWEQPLKADETGVSGCMLDLVQSPGPHVSERDGNLRYGQQSARIVSRRIRVVAPDLPKLPTDAAAAVDAVVAAAGGHPEARSELIVEGNALLAQRARVAMSLFAMRGDYHAFALERLRKFAQTELREIERDLAKAFPQSSAAEIAAAAAASRAGRRAIEAARNPTDGDLVRVLAVWIRDLPVDVLLRDLERRLIDARIRGGTAASLAARWSAVSERFGVPSRIRIAAPLALIHDEEQDVVGFVRVLFPRPERIAPPDRWLAARDGFIDARLPRRPLGLALVESLATQPSVGEALAARAYRAVALRYAPLDPSNRREPGQPYARARVSLTLEATARAAEPVARVSLDADVDGSGDQLAILRLSPTVSGDPTLAALLAK